MAKRPPPEQDRTVTITVIRASVWMRIAKALCDQSASFDDQQRDWMRLVSAHLCDTCKTLPPGAYATLSPRVSTITMLSQVVARMITEPENRDKDLLSAGVVLATCSHRPQEHRSTVTKADVDAAMAAEAEGLRSVTVPESGDYVVEVEA